MGRGQNSSSKEVREKVMRNVNKMLLGLQMFLLLTATLNSCNNIRLVDGSQIRKSKTSNKLKCFITDGHRITPVDQMKIKNFGLVTLISKEDGPEKGKLEAIKNEVIDVHLVYRVECDRKKGFKPALPIVICDGVTGFFRQTPRCRRKANIPEGMQMDEPSRNYEDYDPENYEDYDPENYEDYDPANYEDYDPANYEDYDPANYEDRDKGENYEDEYGDYYEYEYDKSKSYDEIYEDGKTNSTSAEVEQIEEVENNQTVNETTQLEAEPSSETEKEEYDDRTVEEILDLDIEDEDAQPPLAVLTLTPQVEEDDDENQSSGDMDVDKYDRETIKDTRVKFETDDEDLYLLEGSGDDEDSYLVEEGSGYQEQIVEPSTTPRITTTTETNQESEISLEKQQQIRHEFYYQFEVDILRLDMTCVEGDRLREAPKLANAELRDYEKRVSNKASPGAHYSQVSYACREGYELQDSKIFKLYCSEDEWIGAMPTCIPIPGGPAAKPEATACPDDMAGVKCDHLCFLTENGNDYTCECHPGYILAGDGVTCADVDECSSEAEGRNPCDENGVCVNKPGSFECECKQGYRSEADDGFCSDVNECLLNNGHGPCQDVCHNTEGGYFCSCENLVRTKLASDNHTCEESLGCSENNGGCSHECIDSYNQVFCLCPTGYELGADWKTCMDIDECAPSREEDDVDSTSPRLKCDHECFNTPGSARCICRSGFELDEGSQKCVDIDECDGNAFGCADLATCTNTNGGAFCSCPQGYSNGAGGKTCEDIDECLLQDHSCQHFCINTPGDYECGCHTGFRVSSGSNDTEKDYGCQDIDECVEREGLCVHGDCVNLPGSFLCECHKGFEFNSSEQFCMDIDECQDSGRCGEGGECVNLVGNYECNCENGSEFANGTCHDINECLLGNPCVNGDCINASPGYECSCYKGFHFQNGLCEDINECDVSAKENPCGRAGNCKNLQGHYECDCSEGFSFDGTQCVDIDECKSDLQRCGDHADCYNMEGSFECRCHPGFEMNSGKCEDIDECQLPNSVCENGTCNNLPGSFECSCPPGFHLTEENVCTDIDECAYENGGCSHDCVNTVGSFQCRCESGYLIHPNDQFKCVDHDECASSVHNCAHECVNRPGGYECRCFDGFVKSETDPTACVDVDECLVNNGGCQHDCLNVDGSYECKCRDGFLVSPYDKHGCGDINECSRQNGGCSHECKNSDGSFKCICPEGYSLGEDDLTCRRTTSSVVPFTKKTNNIIGGTCRSPPRPPRGLMRCNKKKVDGFYEPGTKCKLKCKKGFKASVSMKKKCMEDGTWIGNNDDAVCRPITCSPLPPIRENGRLEPSTCGVVPSPAGAKCDYICDHGFKISRKSKDKTKWSTKCSRRETWRHMNVTEGAPECVADFPAPFIMCPSDITKSLPGKATSAYVMFPQPKTNVDWFRYVEADPAWAKQLEGEVQRGYHKITFTAISPIQSRNSSRGSKVSSSSCQFVIKISDPEPPRVTQCPKSFTEYLTFGETKKSVRWKEPVFRDNVAIQHVMASYLPGHEFSAGKHHVLYQASDADGNKARCGFTITVLSSTTTTSTTTTTLSTTTMSYSGDPFRPSAVAPPTRMTDAGRCNDVPSMENGRLSCIDTIVGKKCTPICEPGHSFYQQFGTRRPPTYICNEYRIDWQIRRFIPDCSPVKTVGFFEPCPSGWESRNGNTCIGCPPGMFKSAAGNGQGHNSICRYCPKGEYTHSFASSECEVCPLWHTTNKVGSRSKNDCVYRKGTTSAMVSRISNSRAEDNHTKSGTYARTGPSVVNHAENINGASKKNEHRNSNYHHSNRSKLRKNNHRPSRIGFHFYNRWSRNNSNNS